MTRRAAVWMTRFVMLVAAGVVMSQAATIDQADQARGGWGIGAVVHAQSAQPEQQTEFVPIDELPPQDQLPAAPLLVAAYGVVMLAFFVYVVSVARRLTRVQHELERLEADLQRRK